MARGGQHGHSQLGGSKSHRGAGDEGGHGLRDRALPLWRRRPWLGFVITGVVAVAIAGALVATQGSGGRNLLALGAGSASPAGATAPGGRTTTTAPPTTTTTPPPPTVVGLTPTATALPLDSTLTLTLSSPPPAGAPLPSLTPPVPGTWAVEGPNLTFTPSTWFQPWATEDVVVPPGLATTSAPLPALHFAGASLLRAQQLLAELGYLPLRFGSGGRSALSGEPTTASAISPAAQPGSFSWQFPNVPATLSALWAPGTSNTVTQGAVVQFESEHGLTVDGLVGPHVWNALTAAVAARQMDPYPYDYLTVSENLPESLVVWRQGQDIYRTLVNTGVPGRTTPPGTYPVLERFRTTTMTGTDVNGTHYVDPGIPWVAYFYDGDAVHGYVRSAYGYPQSNGCVELPLANAKVVWTMDPIGTLVTVVS
jgi:peptidoglycan hydrolase-like protein with peptidoglycan-binding domain